jgi:hypothetical protein
MIVKFDYPMHDDYNTRERFDIIASSAGIVIDDDLADKIGRPFYEVFLHCALDTDTGAVTILGADS